MEKLIISADSHVFEPGDLWLKALGNRFGERLPTQSTISRVTRAGSSTSGRAGEAAKMDELVDANAKDRPPRRSRAGGFDPAYRLRLMRTTTSPPKC
jgi:hypothetical protein